MFSIHDEVALKSFLESIGEKKFRVEQIYRAIYKDSVDSFQKITTIPKTLQELLEKEAIFSSLSIVRRLDSDDKQTTKLLLATSDGHHIESVIMRHLSGRTTVCISSQVGCPMGCVFCATGKLGLKRNLAFYEILDQILVAIRILMPEGRKLRNVVCMGMGEPFLNYEQLKSALSIVCNQKKMDFSPRRVTVSTCGIIPGIERFRDDFPQASLAISLHAPSNEIRSTIMPVCKPYPLEDLMNTLDAYVAKTNKKIFYEYIMIQGVTDLPICGKLLAKLLRWRLAHVNFIPYNRGEDADGAKLMATERAIIQSFQAELEKAGVPSTIRHTMGDDIDAACGQLAAQYDGWTIDERWMNDC